MKTLALLLPCLFALSLTSCNTLANRRDLYSPGKASGPYYDMRILIYADAPVFGAPNHRR